MKAFAIISIARQVDGEYCIIKIEKAYKDPNLAESYAKSLSKKYAESIQTPNGSIDCVCERGIFEIDIED
jgi:hypothetical protein